jgi:hypothetical protein
MCIRDRLGRVIDGAPMKSLEDATRTDDSAKNPGQ